MCFGMYSVSFSRPTCKEMTAIIMENPKAMDPSWDDLITGIKKRNVRAMARLITRVENREPGWEAAMKAIYPDTGSARVFGITGAPGSGKSTLTGEISRELVRRGLTVGILAVDPSSPFSGGALLGDRLRMKKIFTTNEIFIRSMATRGMLGGLCQAARDVVRIVDAFGKDIILIETVGVGQDEIEIVKTADRVMVVCIPGQGDGIQAIKAGVMEIADLYVINKADRPGADDVEADIRAMLELASPSGTPVPPVLKTSALKNEGIEALVSTLLDAPAAFEPQRAKSELLVKEEILSMIEREFSRYVRRKWEHNGELGSAVSQVLEKKQDPYSIVHELLADFPFLHSENGANE